MSKKLQINERGSWRDVLTNVEAHQEVAVAEATLALATAAGGKSFRLFDIRTQKVWAYTNGSCWEFRGGGHAG